MIYYKLTLLKDLSDIKAGFSATLNENVIENPRGCYFSDPEYPSDTRKGWKYTKMVRELCSYKDDPGFVRIEYDMMKVVQIKCPSCDKIGMFAYEDPEDYRSVDDVDYYYKKAGLFCPHCEHRIHTHTIETKSRVTHW